MRSVRHRADQGIRYQGLSVHAPPGVHEDAFRCLMRHVQPGARVLELGAGSGAFTRRLLDAGMKVDATDFDPNGWALTDVPVVRQDLNEAVWDIPEGRYDVVVAVEVLEHLENPSAALRSARALLRPGGILFFTTPNVASVESRRRMIVRGEPTFFGRGLLFDGGHLTILPFWLLEDVLEKERFQVVERAFLGKQPVVARQGRSTWKRLVVPPIDLLLLALGRRIPRDAAFRSCVGYAVRPCLEAQEGIPA